MSGERVTSANSGLSKPSGTGRLSGLLQRSEAARGISLLSPTLLIMIIGVAIPFGILVVMSFWTQVGFGFDTSLTLANYQNFGERPIYGALLTRSLWMSGAATVATVLLCYPMAYFVAFHIHRNKMIWIVLITLPFWTSYLLRVFAWKVVLGYEGVINSALMTLGLIKTPLEFLLYSQSAVVITLAHAWAAFAILPMYVSLEKIDKSLLEAATDLGDGPVWRFFRITLPLSLPGVISASLLIFIPTTGDYITPALLGGPDGAMIGNLIQKQFGAINNWPMGATLSIILMLSIATIALVFMFVTNFVRKRIS
ncbi:Spermidine/putrescine transport system permease protein PotB [Roseovarius litorisediminis]|uniref:Spermidine/putrescine transport system permease protein PotB n=1 Tax=Roseovarius litorisediminis TaxID=1312363 RepID=A0A1Y5SV79_9RHOB|nr:ABC transporter permease [Roseovarius litorisediminis]SLN49086.1 Spermidine/putrescine transport system permease protein PotB [Roseovarius litorisediminis]